MDGEVDGEVDGEANKREEGFDVHAKKRLLLRCCSVAIPTRENVKVKVRPEPKGG